MFKVNVMSVKTLLLYFLLLSFSTDIVAQIGIGTTSPDNSSVLDISSTNKGLLPPRLSTSQRNGITNPAEGLVIYNLTEKCLQINIGSPSSPDWSSLSASSSPSSSSTVVEDCSINGFSGAYSNGINLSGTKFSVTVTNNSFSTVDISFVVGDLVLSGISGVSVSSVNPPSATLTSGQSGLIEYTLVGTPGAVGALSGVWTKLGLTCTRTVSVLNGDANFILPVSSVVVSLTTGNIQGIVDNASNKLTVKLPYTGGSGSYDAYSGVAVVNTTGTGESGDVNSFHLSYPSGTFTSSGFITATIVVSGSDVSFNAKKQSPEVQSTIASLDFQVNGVSKGVVNLDALGGILDRNFADANHKFIYLPITLTYGGSTHTWLNNNLGANYANSNLAGVFNPSQQATSHTDLNAYGSLFQWGRAADGHELITYSNSTTGAGVTAAITGQTSNSTPSTATFYKGSPNWLTSTNNTLWQGESGLNNPCPVGYRVPTNAELTAVVSHLSITNLTSAGTSALAFSASGYRVSSNGTVINVGSFDSYWSSSVTGANAHYRFFSSNNSNTNNINRAYGIGVRCLKD